MPFGDRVVLRPHPDAISAKAQPVPPGYGSTKASKPDLGRFVGADHHGNRFTVTRLRIRRANSFRVWHRYQVTLQFHANQRKSAAVFRAFKLDCAEELS